MQQLAYVSSLALCLMMAFQGQGPLQTLPTAPATQPDSTPKAPEEIKPSDAQVTFYSHGVTLLGGLPGQAHGAFKGRIYEGDHQLAFMEPAHFVSFSFAPGPHEFSATWWVTKDAKKGSHVLVNLAENQHYFIETYIRNTTIFGGVALLIREVTCDAAKRDNAESKPLEQPHLRPDGRSIFVADTAFPTCP